MAPRKQAVKMQDATEHAAQPESKLVALSGWHNVGDEVEDIEHEAAGGEGEPEEFFVAWKTLKQEKQGEYANAFIKAFTAEQQRLLDDAKIRDSALVENDDFFKASVTSAISTLPAKNSHNQTSIHPTANSRTLHGLVKETLHLCHAVEVHLDNLSNTLAAKMSNEALVQTWQSDHDKLSRILEIGERVTERQINSFMRRREVREEQTNEITGKEEAAAVALLDLRLPGHEGRDALGSWNDVVISAENGIKRLTRALPDVV